MATSEWILSVRPCYLSYCVKWNEILQYRIPLVIQWTVLRSVCHEWDQMGSSFGELMGFISTHCLHGAYIKHWIVSCKTCQNNNSIMPNRLISSRHFTYSSPFIKANRTLPRFHCYSAEQRSLSIMSSHSLNLTVTTQSLASTEGKSISSGCPVSDSLPYTRATTVLPWNLTEYICQSVCLPRLFHNDCSR